MSGIFTAAVKRGVAPHTRKQRVLAAISKLRSAFFTGYKNKICTYYINLHVLYIYIYIHDSQLNRPESVSLASLTRQLEKWFPLQGERGRSSYFSKQNREEGETEYKQQAYQFTQCYNILHRLQVHHPILPLSYTINILFIYIHTYIYILF